MAKRVNDLTFKRDAFGYRVYADTLAGEAAYAKIVEQNGGSDYVLSVHWPRLVEALKIAGYSVGRARIDRSTINDEELLAALAE